jgi:hypothetical protein
MEATFKGDQDLRSCRASDDNDDDVAHDHGYDDMKRINVLGQFSAFQIYYYQRYTSVI